MIALAYVNWSRWVANCPRYGCTNAMELEPGQQTFHCGGMDGCLLVAPVKWPDNAEVIMSVLAARPIPAKRNWLPSETVADLERENDLHGVWS